MGVLLDLALAVLVALLVALTLWLVAVLLVRRPGVDPGDLRGLGQALAGAANPGPTALVLAICIAVLGALGAATLIGDADLDAFVINQEGTVPTFFSSALLLIAGGLSLLLGADQGHGRRWWLFWGGVLFALGLDEAAEAHERFEERLDLPGPVVLAPIAAAAAIAYLRTFRMIAPGSLSRRLYLAGAALWAVALLSDPIRGVGWKSVMEEVFEMGGSALILLALLLLVRGTTSGPRPAQG